jgi:hypothetical protein
VSLRCIEATAMVEAAIAVGTAKSLGAVSGRGGAHGVSEGLCLAAAMQMQKQDSKNQLMQALKADYIEHFVQSGVREVERQIEAATTVEAAVALAMARVMGKDRGAGHVSESICLAAAQQIQSQSKESMLRQRRSSQQSAAGPLDGARTAAGPPAK